MFEAIRSIDFSNLLFFRADCKNNSIAFEKPSLYSLEKSLSNISLVKDNKLSGLKNVSLKISSIYSFFKKATPASPSLSQSFSSANFWALVNCSLNHFDDLNHLTNALTEV